MLVEMHQNIKENNNLQATTRAIILWETASKQTQGMTVTFTNSWVAAFRTRTRPSLTPMSTLKLRIITVCSVRRERDRMTIRCRSVVRAIKHLEVLINILYLLSKVIEGRKERGKGSRASEPVETKACKKPAVATTPSSSVTFSESQNIK